MRRLTLIIMVMLITLPGYGWTPKTEVEIAREALDLGPEDLRRVVGVFDESFREGMRDAARDERSSRRADHFALTGDQLAERILAETNEAIRMMREREPMPSFVYRLGVIAHLVGDANNPFLTSAVPRLYDYRADYESYVERRLPKIPPVFYGIDRPLTPAVTIANAIDRSRSYGSLLRSEYERGDRIRTSREFDDRSTAFAIASLSWSHAMSDLTNIYYYIWKESGGDVRRAHRLRRGVLPKKGR